MSALHPDNADRVVIEPGAVENEAADKNICYMGSLGDLVLSPVVSRMDLFVVNSIQ